MAVGYESAKLSQWRLRLERFERSGLSVAQFCREEGVSAPSFYQWRKRLGRQRRTRSTGNGPSSFAAVRVVGAPNVQVRLPGGTIVDVPTGNAETVRLVIDTLARVDGERAGGTPC